MGDIQYVELDDLVPIVGGQAQWIYDLSRGICNENVSEKLAPKSASAIKTFKEIFSLEKILKQVCLVCSDLIEKIKEHMRDKNVYPCSLVLT
jgi:nucleotidyltransferase/DNA polymerase involved in DNA repair